MISNADCTLLIRTVNPISHQYEWEKKVYTNVYFECFKSSNVDSKKDSCYCCIYNQTSIDAKIEDIIVKDTIQDNNIDITNIKNRYQTFSISKITICDIGNLKHIEIEGV